MLLDMPLEKLKVYQGINPKPDDFDEFWDASLQEMHAIDPTVTYRDNSFKAPGVICRDMFFTGAQGARIHAYFARPEKTEGCCPALVLFHGYTGSAPDFMKMLPYVYAGFVVASMDVRGQGGISEDTSSIKGPTVYGHIVNGLLDEDPKNLFFRNVFLDAAQLAGILMDREDVDPQRVGCMGGSQGGALSLVCASLEPRIAVAVSCYPWLSDYQRVWEMDMDERAYVGLKDFFRHFDPTHERQAEIFNRLGYIDVHHLCPRIRGQVMMGTGLMDNVCPPSTQFAAFNAISGEKSMVLYPDFGHENLPGFDMKAHQLLMTLR